MKKISKDKVKRFDFSKKVKRCNPILKPITRLVAYFKLRKFPVSIDKVSIEGLHPPFLVLGNHHSYIDMALMVKTLSPFSVNYVSALDAIKDHGEWLMRQIGLIGKRKFIKDVRLLKNMKYALDNYKNHCMVLYPEAKFSLDGTTSYYPKTIGKLAKFLKVPIVVVTFMGNYIAQPQWAKRSISEIKFKDIPKIPLSVKVKLIATKTEVMDLPEEELQRRFDEAFAYDDFKYQKDNKIKIELSDRAEGLNKILYKCPHCGTEYEMSSSGAILRCNHCDKKWFMNEYGELSALNGETEFDHIPDWFSWEKEEVAKEIASGNYRFEDDVEVDTLPNAKGFYHHGVGKLYHTVDGFKLECYAYGEKTVEVWDGIETDGLHIEYNYKGKGDVIDISTNTESYWLYPKTKKDCITKLSLATDEIYRIKSREKFLKTHRKEE